jgi:hypothetical protein
MTAARHGANAIAAVLLSIAAAATSAAGSPAGRPLVVNTATGLALSGFDPVAYFADAKAEPGRGAFELGAEGVVWRFRNEGNRAAFRKHPDVYRPGFGGYDPIAIARDRAVPGHPLFWTISGERLYLFYSAGNRDRFLADPGAALDAANQAWPQVEKSAAR